MAEHATKGETKMSIYEAMQAAGIKTDSHESDLYAEDTPAARAVLIAHGSVSVSRFFSQIDRHIWIDIPFSYDPFWDAAAS